MLLPCDVCAAAGVKDAEVWSLVSNAVVDRRPAPYMERLISCVSTEPQTRFAGRRSLQAFFQECRMPTSLLGQRF